MDIISNFIISEAQIPYHTAIMILTFPIISTLIAVFRYYLGIKSFGLYPHIILIYTFYSFSIISDHSLDFLKGFKLAMLFLVIAILAISSAKILLDRVNFHIVPKKNLFLTIGLLSILLVFLIANQFDRRSILEVQFLGILAILTLSEKFLNFSIKKSTKSALSYMTNTIITSTILAFLITSTTFQTILLENTWIILIAILINVIVGNYTGMRLSELIRFRKISNE